MKKSIKYAGIAAATLLTVAPIAAPVVSNATTVQAADVSTDKATFDKALTAFGNQLADFTASSSSKATLGNGQSATNFYDNNTALATQDTNADLAVLGAYTVDVSAKVGKTTVDSQADLDKYLADDTYPAITFTVTLHYTDNNNVAASKTYTVTANRDANTDAITKLNVNYDTPVTVALNSTVTSTQLTGTSKIKVTDQNGEGILSGKVTPGENYYYSYQDAMNAAEGTANADILDSTVTPNTFKKAGTYYQTITLSSTSDTSAFANFLNNYLDNASTSPVYINGSLASAGYDFSYDKTAGTLNLVRKVVVSSDSSNWTTEKTSGVVTTKNDATYYTLKNDNNVTIKNRALAANTGWKTNAVRTDQNGNKQYRVATGEWVDANDVTFGDSTTTDTDSSALTDIQKVNGTVNLDKGNYQYMLYKKDGSLIKNRQLAGGSAWHAINTAKDSEGNTYYRVATNEWLISGTGVNFSLN